jgi:hypothetical protein
MEVGGHRHASALLPPGKNHGTHWIGDWVGHRVDLYSLEKIQTLDHLVHR